MAMGSMVIPSFRYKDARAAMVWLETVLGFARKAVYENHDGTVEHAELVLGTGMIMLGSASNVSPYPDRNATPADVGMRVTSPMYVIVEDCEPVWERAKAAGVEVLMALTTMSYGGKAFTIGDPEGFVWAVGEYDPWK
jgi:uncharacterized glyoxalase superfamily protein PhnB